jgi:hypothetical protein
MAPRWPQSEEYVPGIERDVVIPVGEQNIKKTHCGFWKLQVKYNYYQFCG